MRINSGYTETGAAYHSFHLLSELLVQQCINKRVDSSIEQDHCVSDGDRNGTNATRVKSP